MKLSLFIRCFQLFYDSVQIVLSVILYLYLSLFAGGIYGDFSAEKLSQLIFHSRRIGTFHFLPRLLLRLVYLQNELFHISYGKTFLMIRYGMFAP